MNVPQLQEHQLPLPHEGRHLHLVGCLNLSVEHSKEAVIPVLMLHGFYECGRIFYSKKGRGLGPWLARHGCEAWSLDFGGHGKSAPQPSKKVDYSQETYIQKEIPLAIEYLFQKYDRKPVALVCHSWGGVLALSALARREELRDKVRCVVFFGSKRRIEAFNFEIFWKVKLFWDILFFPLVWILGYVPAISLGLGTDNCARTYFRDTNRWVRRGSKWMGPDGFDYAKALKNAKLPPLLFLAGQVDRSLGVPSDVELLRQEAAQTGSQFLLLGVKSGHSKDYGHVDMLTDPQAIQDHFPAVLSFIQVSPS